jgi:hypothetical protein
MDILLQMSMEVGMLFLYNSEFSVQPLNLRMSNGLDSRSHETRAHLGNNLHKIFTKNYRKFQGGFLRASFTTSYFSPSITSSLISLAMFKPTPAKPSPHLFERE